MEDAWNFADLVGLAEAVWLAGGVLLTLFGTLIFGRRYKQRIAALEADAEKPAISETINIQGDFIQGDLVQGDKVQDAMASESVRSIKETIDGLPQTSLDDGGSYVELPDKTLLVTRADGSLILALPVTASIRSGTPRIEVKLEEGSVSSVD